MKIRVFLRAFMILALFLATLGALVSCQDEAETPEATYYTVTFDSNGGSAIEPKTILKGQKSPDPGAPEREGYVFGGWMHDGAQWDFSTRSVREDMTLIARWYSAEAIFSYEVIEGTDNARITKLKERLEELEVPSVISGFTVTEIGEGVFSEMSVNYTQKISIPSTVTTIGVDAFSGSEGIEILFDRDCQLTQIGENAFSGCTGLTSVPLGEGLTEVASWSFSGCTALRELQIPESVTVLRENAFGGCSSLRWVMMHSAITAIEDSAFEDCDGFQTIYFYGSAEQIDTLLEKNTANMNDVLVDATVYLYSEAEPTTEGAYGYWHWDDNDTVKLW